MLLVRIAGVLLVAQLALAGAARSQPAVERLTEERAVRLALEKNPALAAAMREVEAAAAEVGVASAGYYPALDLNATRTEQSRASGRGDDGGGTRVQLETRHTLLDFDRRFLGAEAARLVARAAEWAAGAVRQEVVLKVRRQYYLTHTDQETVRIQQGVVANQERHLRQAEGFYRAGLQARIEVTKAEAELAQANLDLISARNRLEQDWVTLNVAMGVPGVTEYLLELEPVEWLYLEADAPRLVEIALERRPEVRQGEAEAESLRARMEQVYRDRLPALSANAATGLQDTSGPMDEFWTVGLELEWNLFNGFLDHHQAEAFRARAEALRLQLEETRNDVFRETTTAWVDLRNAHAAIESARAGVRASRDNFRLAQRRYETGLGSNLEYQDAQVLLSRAEIGEVQASNDYRTALASLLRATGVESFEELRGMMP